MSENFYKEALSYALDQLEQSYKEQGKESEFIFNFDMNYVDETMDSVTVSVASPFMNQMMIKKNVFSIVEAKLQEVTGKNVKLINVVKNESEAEKSETISKLQEEKPEFNNEPENKSDEEIKPKKKHPQLNPEYTFDTFIPGDNCRFAYNASQSISKEPGTGRNPVLIYGDSGLGKTHLMQAIGNYIYNDNPKLKICYVSAEKFTNDFLESLKTKKTKEFKDKYRNVDVLLLDDIHFLQRKEQTQEELFYTFNELFEHKKQMVFTCDRPLKEIKEMEARLIGRLNMGLTIDIQAPKYEERYAILQKKIELMNKSLDSEIIDYIAKNIETNVRDLNGALVTLINYEDLAGEKLNLDQAKNLLKNLISDSDENINFETIEKVIAEEYQISVADLKGKKREKKYVIPRQYAIYIAKTLTEATYSNLAQEFGNKDHTTIMYACRKMDEQLKIDQNLKSKIDLYIRKIREYKK